MEYVMYGHAGDGNIDTRPLVDMESPEQVRRMNYIASNVFGRAAANGGTITGEHGDGLARLRFIKQLYGEHIVNVFRQVKELFDPRYLLNPGKKVPLLK